MVKKNKQTQKSHAAFDGVMQFVPVIGFLNQWCVYANLLILNTTD